MAAQNQPDGYLFKLRDESDRARAEFERIQLDAQTTRATAVALNNGCTDDLFADLFQNTPKFVPGPFDVKCALLIVRGEDNQWKVDSRLSGATAATFPNRVVVGKYHAVIGNDDVSSSVQKRVFAIVKSISGDISGGCGCFINDYTIRLVEESNKKIITTFTNGRKITSHKFIDEIYKLDPIITADQKLGAPDHWIADSIIEFDIDNYGNLFHTTSGLYIVFNRTPLPATAFKFLLNNGNKIFNYLRVASGSAATKVSLDPAYYALRDSETEFFKNVVAFIPLEYQQVATYIAKFQLVCEALQQIQPVHSRDTISNAPSDTVLTIAARLKRVLETSGALEPYIKQIVDAHAELSLENAALKRDVAATTIAKMDEHHSKLTTIIKTFTQDENAFSAKYEQLREESDTRVATLQRANIALVGEIARLKADAIAATSVADDLMRANVVAAELKNACTTSSERTDAIATQLIGERTERRRVEARLAEIGTTNAILNAARNAADVRATQALEREEIAQKTIGKLMAELVSIGSQSTNALEPIIAQKLEQETKRAEAQIAKNDVLRDENTKLKRDNETIRKKVKEFGSGL